MHYPKEIYFAGTVMPNTLVDISAFIEQKIEAVRCHKSQIKDLEGIGRRMKTNTLRMYADGSERYVEHFRRVLL